MFQIVFYVFYNRQKGYLTTISGYERYGKRIDNHLIFNIVYLLFSTCYKKQIFARPHFETLFSGKQTHIFNVQI